MIYLLILEVTAASKCTAGIPKVGGNPETEAVYCATSSSFLSSFYTSDSIQNSHSLDHNHSKMWNSIPKYLTEDVEICRMQKLVKEEEERVEKLKEEVKRMMLRRRFNSAISCSTTVRIRGG